MRLAESDDAAASRLVALCESGQQAEEVKRLLRASPSLVCFVDSRGRTPLAAAVASGSVAVVAVVLSAGAVVDRQGKGGWTALHSACQKGHAEVVKELLGAGASCSVRNEDMNTPLHYAVRRPEIPEELLAVVVGRSDVNAANKGGETALFIAAWRDNVVAAQLLLKCGAQVNLRNASEQTPLHAASLFGSERCCRALIEAGANVLAKDASGVRAADVASNAACAALLREATANAERRERVIGWLSSVGVDPRYHEAFVKEEFDLASLALVTESVLAAMKLPVAVRLTVMHNARLLQQSPKRSSLAASGNSNNSNSYSGRLDNTTSDMEEDCSSATGGGAGGGAEELRAELLARNVPLVDPLDLQLRHVIGSGFFSSVRLAEWHGVLVACKSITESPHRLKNQRELFLQEVAIMAKLRHPNVVQFLGVTLDADSGPFAILTEYMAGGTLHAAIRSPRWREPEEQLRRFFRLALDMCKGMVYLHGVAVIHRDLTPKNVLLDREGAKIADFGVSRLNDIDYITHPVGALPYVAPEVYLHHKYSAAADVYSFAVIVWEMLTGRDACGSMKPRELADAVAHQGYRPPLPPAQGWIEQPLLSLLCSAWEGAPEGRPTFRALLHSLESMVSVVADAGYVLEREEL